MFARNLAQIEASIPRVRPMSPRGNGTLNSQPSASNPLHACPVLCRADCNEGRVAGCQLKVNACMLHGAGSLWLKLTFGIHQLSSSTSPSTDSKSQRSTAGPRSTMICSCRCRSCSVSTVQAPLDSIIVTRASSGPCIYGD